MDDKNIKAETPLVEQYKVAVAMQVLMAKVTKPPADGMCQRYSQGGF